MDEHLPHIWDEHDEHKRYLKPPPSYQSNLFGYPSTSAMASWITVRPRINAYTIYNTYNMRKYILRLLMERIRRGTFLCPGFSKHFFLSIFSQLPS